MSNELIAILVVGSVLAFAELVTFAISLRALGEISRMVNALGDNLEAFRE